MTRLAYNINIVVFLTRLRTPVNRLHQEERFTTPHSRGGVTIRLSWTGGGRS
jgi:hypothetical protein